MKDDHCTRASQFASLQLRHLSDSEKKNLMLYLILIETDPAWLKTQEVQLRQIDSAMFLDSFLLGRIQTLYLSKVEEHGEDRAGHMCREIINTGRKKE